jgi:hypothetical protein
MFRKRERRRWQILSKIDTDVGGFERERLVALEPGAGIQTLGHTILTETNAILSTAIERLSAYL